MTTRVAGRHRSTKSWNPPSSLRPLRPPSLLLLDYLETGLLPRVPARPAGRFQPVPVGPFHDPQLPQVRLQAGVRVQVDFAAAERL